MPHLHSAAAREVRAARAAARGYLRRARPGTRFLEVPTELHEKGRIMMKSLKLHRVHSGICGHPTHYARDATIGARSVIGEQAFVASMKTHGLANTAKHTAGSDGGDDSDAHLLSPARPTATRRGPVGTPDGKLIGNLAEASAQEKVLLQKMVESQANLLVRIRQVEKQAHAVVAGESEGCQSAKSIEAVVDSVAQLSKVLQSTVDGIGQALRDLGDACRASTVGVTNVRRELLEHIDTHNGYSVRDFEAGDSFAMLKDMCAGVQGTIGGPYILVRNYCFSLRAMLPIIREARNARLEAVVPCVRAGRLAAMCLDYSRFDGVGDSEDGSDEDPDWRQAVPPFLSGVDDLAEDFG